jgi:tetratricopeptide (TPR) repeat protein
MSVLSKKLSFPLKLAFLLILVPLPYGCATVAQIPKVVKETAETPFRIVDKIINIEKMPELPKEIFDLAKAPVDLARSFTHLGWEEQFSSVGDRRGKGYSSQGVRYMSDGNFEEAAYYFQLASNRDPKNTEHLSLLAWSYFKLNQYDKALELFTKIKELNPKVFDAYTGPGWIYFKTGQYDQAVGNFEAAITEDRAAG